MGLFGVKATKSRTDKLEEIDNGIEKAENQRDNVIKLKRKVLFWILLIFGLIFICSAIYMYFVPEDSTLSEKLLRSLPMILTPVIAFLMWKPIDMYFIWLITQKVGKIEKLKRGKDKVLKRLLENQSYLEPKSPMPSPMPSPPHPTSNVVVLAISPNEIQRLVRV